MPLADGIIVYPAHGAGSACGKNLSKETFGLLGDQKKTNYALRANMTKAEFVKEVLDGIAPPPQYFAKNAKLNKTGYGAIDKVMARGSRPLNLKEFEMLQEDESIMVLDVRDKAEFVEGFIPGSIFIGIDGGFAPWVGTLIEDLDTPILQVAPEGREEEAITRLSRVGYDNVKGFLKGGIKAWEQAGEEVDALLNMTPKEFADSIEKHNVDILDVRKESEFYSEHIVNDKVINSCLDRLMTGYKNLDKDKEYYVHCAGGYRSVIAISILKNLGFKGLVNVDEGFAGIKMCENIQTSEYVCPTSML